MNTSNPPSSPPPSLLLTTARRTGKAVLAIAGIGFILWLDSWFMHHVDMPQLNRDMSYGLLFVVGLLTGFHCVGMCGPLIVGYAAKNAAAGIQSHASHFLYGIGKTLSYTVIGSLFGLFGSVVAFTPYTQGAVGIAAGVFLILFGLHMLNVFQSLNHFQVKMPAPLMRFVGREYRKHHSPFVIGLLNGLMILCGPLQAMYVMAAGTGSWSEGAAILFFFGLGTLPLALGFGFLTSLLSASMTPKLLKASGVIVMVLGAIMLNRGLSVTGTGFDFNTLTARLAEQWKPVSAQTTPAPLEQTIVMEVLNSGYSPNQFTLRKGVPVKWVINAKELNECNRGIVVPRYGLKIMLKPGLQTIEFTPQEAGVVAWSCWMGMIPGTFIVSEPSTGESKPAAASGNEGMASLAGIRQRLRQEIAPLWHQLADWFNQVSR